MAGIREPGQASLEDAICHSPRSADQGLLTAHHRGSRTRSIETCEIHAPGDSITNVWRVPLVRTVSNAVIGWPSTFASITPLTFCPETEPPWRYVLSNQLPERTVPFSSILALKSIL